MVKLRAGHSSNPRLQPLIDGTIQPTGIELEFETIPPPQLFHRQLTENDLDVFEFSLSSYMIRKDRWDPQKEWDWVGVPIFLSRAFVALNTFVNDKSGMQSFADIKGKRFGLPDYNMTAGLWMRAMIQDLYGVRPQDVTWHVGRGAELSHGMALGLDQDPPKDVDIKWLPGGVQLGEMLVNGEIDAMFPDSSTQLYNAPNVKRLFSDGGKAFIADFAHHRGFTPVNHTLVVQRRVVDEHPWVPEALYEAFEKSKQEAFRRDRSTSMLFKGDDYEEQATLFGADPYPSGLSVNRKMLQRGMEQSLAEGMLKKSLDIDALYAESLRGT